MGDAAVDRDVVGAAAGGDAGGLIGLNELADLLGISARRVQQYAEDGVIVKAAHGQYVLRESVRRYCESLRESASGRNAPADERAEKTRLLKFQADMMELKLAEASGQFLRRDEVEMVIAEGIASARSEFMASARELKKLLDKKHGIDIELSDIIGIHHSTLVRLAEHSPELAGDDPRGLVEMAAAGESEHG